ncbi:hypothetical protein [Sphingobium yanoikuyae]|uniref:hypothetical protein n=1 Tax=Sphingobium yanoikuyae TaxID=13690 RepID=UPI002FD962A8
MRDLSLTRSERFLLNEVDSVPDKVVRWTTLRQAARHMTCLGFSRVVDKMLRRNLLARDRDAVTLTFAGMQALKS